MKKRLLIILTCLLFATAAVAATFHLYDKTAKTSLAGADIFGIEDSAASWVVKKVSLTSLLTWIQDNILVDSADVSVVDNLGNSDSTDNQNVLEDLDAAITVNNAKVSFDTTTASRLANTSGTNTGDQDLSGLAQTANLGTAAADDTGTSIGDIPVLVDDGSGNPSLNFALFDASGFSGNLLTSYDTFQELFDWLDGVTLGGDFTWSTVPSYEDSAGSAGDMAYDDNYLYIKTSTIWKTVALVDTLDAAPTTGTLAVSPTSWDPADGTTATSDASQTLTVTATGDVDFSSYALTTGAYFADAGTGTCTQSSSLSDSSCTIDLIFQYDTGAVTDHSDTLTITSDATDSPETVSLGPTTVTAVTDGFVGNNCTLTSNTLAGPGADQGVSQVWTPTISGTISYIHVALSYTTTSDEYNVAVYSSDGTTKLAESNLTTYDSTWTTFALDSQISVDTGTPIKLVVGSKTDTDWRIAAENDLANPNEVYHSWSLDVEDTMPSSVTDSGGSTTSSDVCIYGDNTP